MMAAQWVFETSIGYGNRLLISIGSTMAYMGSAAWIYVSYNKQVTFVAVARVCDLLLLTQMFPGLLPSSDGAGFGNLMAFLAVAVATELLAALLVWEFSRRFVRDIPEDALPRAPTAAPGDILIQFDGDNPRSPTGLSPESPSASASAAEKEAPAVPTSTSPVANGTASSASSASSGADDATLSPESSSTLAPPSPLSVAENSPQQQQQERTNATGLEPRVVSFSVEASNGAGAKPTSLHGNHAQATRDRHASVTRLCCSRWSILDPWFNFIMRQEHWWGLQLFCRECSHHVLRRLYMVLLLAHVTQDVYIAKITTNFSYN